MKTLFEKIMSIDSSRLSEEKNKVREEMDRAEIFHIQNVADYYYEINEDGYLITDMPNVAPPFPSFWMEFIMPKMFRAEGKISKNPYTGNKYGYLFSSSLSEQSEFVENFPDAKWMTSVFFFALVNGELYQQIVWRLGIKENGEVARLGDGRLCYGITFQEGVTEEFTSEETANALAVTYLTLALLAVSFLHCKNVSIVPRNPKTATKRRSRHESRIKYHTLQIEPMKKILRQEGKAEETGLRLALHICRGHFKDYTQGKGLFGRYKDVYWWESQVRGSGEHGVVVKDYNVNDPND